MKTNFLQKHYKQLLVTIGLLIILFVIVFICGLMRKEMNELRIEDVEMYQYFGTQRFDYHTSLVLEHNNTVTELKVNDEVVALDSTPFYYATEKKVLFPANMSVVFPKSGGVQYKLKYFSYADGTGLDNYLKNESLNTLVSDVFIYDGNDLYFFLEKTNINFQGNTVTIPAFSYVIYNYNKELYIFNYDMQTMDYYENVSDATASSEDYTINLSIDSLIMGDTTRLLLKNLEFLDSLK